MSEEDEDPIRHKSYPTKQLSARSPASLPGVKPYAPSTGPRLGPAPEQVESWGRKSSPFVPKRRLSDFSGRTCRSPARSCQRLLLDVLQIVVQSHLLPDQPFDGKLLNDLVLGPDDKLLTLGPHLQQDRPVLAT